MQSTDRAEYEAWIARERLRHAARGITLKTIIRAGLTPCPPAGHANP
jgi:hypothetical protein